MHEPGDRCVAGWHGSCALSLSLSLSLSTEFIPCLHPRRSSAVKGEGGKYPNTQAPKYPRKSEFRNTQGAVWVSLKRPLNRYPYSYTPISPASHPAPTFVGIFGLRHPAPALPLGLPSRLGAQRPCGGELSDPAFRGASLAEGPHSHTHTLPQPPNPQPRKEGLPMNV